VKQKVASERGIEASQMRLIWSGKATASLLKIRTTLIYPPIGKILADANQVSSYEIKPTDQIVCMVQKVR